jgi:vacuolar-type H+-ATPase subunit B/Vma2
MKKSLTAAWIVIGIGTSVAAYAQNASLRVGAAKVDVTPAQADLPKNYDGILDHIYSRAIVIDNGSSTAALITVDAGGVPDPIWQAVS